MGEIIKKEAARRIAFNTCYSLINHLSCNTAWIVNTIMSNQSSLSADANIWKIVKYELSTVALNTVRWRKTNA